MRKMLFALGVALLTLVAQASAASACTLLFYQPELPKALREE